MTNRNFGSLFNFDGNSKVVIMGVFSLLTLDVILLTRSEVVPFGYCLTVVEIPVVPIVSVRCV
jgi:hypothetical protein